MLLTLPERFQTMMVLPDAGNFATLKILRKLREALAPSEKEVEDFGITTEENQIRWNPEKVLDADGKHRTAEIEIGKKATSIIVEALEKLDVTKKLTAQHFSIYEKFVDGDGEQTEE